MANQSILTGIRRLWEYMTVPSQGSVSLDIEEEHDPVREFIERQSRGDVSAEVVDDADVMPEKKPGSKAARNHQPDAIDTSPPPEVAAVDSAVDLNQLASEAPVQMDDGPPVETKSEVPQDIIDGEEETESEVSTMTVKEEHQEEEQTEGEQKEEEPEGEAQKGGNDDLLDIFRSEKEIKEKDIIQEILVDIDAHELLEETRELMAEINTRRYRKR